MDLRPLLNLPDLVRARSAIVARDSQTFEEQVRIVGIPAPTFQEDERGDYLLRRFADLGLGERQRDEVGNILATLPSTRPSAPAVIVAAHLDTIFSADTDVTPRTVGKRTYAPGITDNARGLAGLLAVAGALTGTRITTVNPLWFVGTVGEEGIGDLRGVKHLFRRFSPERVGAFISLDGSGSRRVVHRAIGSLRVRASLSGEGGHSWSDWGTPNPIHALGDAIARINQIPVNVAGAHALTIARIGGGTSVNAIPAEGWIEVDMRSEDRGALARMEEAVRAALFEAAGAENARGVRGKRALEVKLEQIGDRPAGMVSSDAPLVSLALSATRALGGRPELAASSTDANVPMALGVPAITIGAGGESGGIHTLGEWYANEGGARGLERALITVLGAAGIASAAGPAA